MADRKALRCAIYTRKSTEFGLEQDFNSLDAQREACEAYIKSQAHEGWKLLPTKYDDGGISGATLQRAALKTLLADVNAGKIDIIVVYKVDRLTRSLPDFAKLVELFDSRGVSFVSITQQFNTTTSMGRLTLNVLLSFAQFEREVTAERIRDKIAASRQKGIWMGGGVPLGYYVKDRKLLIDETEAEQVRSIFRRYLEMSGIKALKEDLDAKGHLTKRKVLSTGRVVGGIPFYTGPLAYLLKNRVYIGECQHGDKFYPGKHEAIIDRELFNAVHDKLTSSAVAHKRARMTSDALLIGCIYDDAGNRMSPTSSQRGAMRYRFYLSTAKTFADKSKVGSLARVSAKDVETAVVTAIRQQLIGSRAEQDTTVSDRELIEIHVKRVVISNQSITIDVHSNARESAAGNTLDGERQAHEGSDDAASKTIIVPFRPKSRDRHREVIQPSTDQADEPLGIRADSRQILLRGIAKARAWADELAQGRIANIEEIAKREDCSARYIRLTLPLAFLAPSIVEAIYANAVPVDLGISRLTDGLPYSWKQQRQKFGF
jgi:DNA invertase Pin-like site-specific DNA recombinase